MPGPQRQPTAIKKLRGNPGKRALPKDEPKPALALPSPPKMLDVTARAEWIRVARILHGVRVLTEADLAVLKFYCVAFSRACEAEALVDKEGVVITEMRGSGDNLYEYRRENPAVGVELKAQKQATEMARELGLTPASRTKIQSAPEDTRAPLEQLRNRLRSIKGGKS